MASETLSGAPTPGAPVPDEGSVTKLRRRIVERLAAGDVPGAEALIDELVGAGQAQGRADLDAWVHLLRARVAVTRLDHDDAGRLATRACGEFLALGPNPAAALGLASLARLLDELHRFDEAVEALAVAAFIADQLTAASPTLVEACDELTSVFAELEVFDVAYRHAERAYVVTLSGDDPLATVDRCVALARLAARFGDEMARSGDDDAELFFERAEQAARLGLDLAARHRSSPAQRQALDLALGSTLVSKGRGAEALAMLDGVLAALSPAVTPEGSPEGLADGGGMRAAARLALGRAHAAAGDHIRAIDHLGEAARWCEEHGDKVLLPGALTALALSQATVGRTNAAFASLRRVVDAEQDGHHHRRRRVAEVIGDRLRVVTDEHTLVRRNRTFSTDPVTGLADQRHVEGAIDELGKRWAGHDVSLVLLDIDNLDSIRQRYAPEITDEVLRRLASVLRAQQRDDDVAARWGDDCFAVLLPRCPEAAGEHVAERLRRAIGDVPWADLAFGLNVSASTGTASARAPFDLGALVLEAGASLYVTRALRSFDA